MANKGKGFEEASLDDFFQPPADIGSPAEGPIPVSEDDVSDAFADISSPAAPVHTMGGGSPQVEELPITNLGKSGPDKKKILIIAGAVLGGLLVLGGLYFFLFAGEETPPAPAPVITEEDLTSEAPQELPTAKAPAIKRPKVTRLSDLDRSPVQAHEAGSGIFNAATNTFTDDGKTKVAALAAPMSFYIGTFIVPKHLDDAKEKLRAAAVTPKVKEGKSSVTMHRLHVGSYDSRAPAERAKSKLKGSGFDAFVIKESRTSYQLYAGSFFTKEEASSYQNKLGAGNTGFIGELIDTRVEMTTWELWGGSFADAAAVEGPLGKLLQQGIEVDVVGNR